MPTREPSMTAGGTAPASRLRVLVVSHVFDPEPFRINQVVADLVVAGAEATVLTGQPTYHEGRVYPGYSDRQSVVSGKRVSVSVDLGGARLLKKTTKNTNAI